jgi:hypothetical protein
VNEIKLIFIAHVLFTLMLTGLIWMIQLVHYPLFAEVGADAFRAYQVAHMNAITTLVGPLMLAELLTGMLLLAVQPTGVVPWQTWVGMVLIAIAWLSTMFISVPQHNQLMSGFDAQVHQALVLGNLIRTLAWTARAGLMGWMLVGALR